MIMNFFTVGYVVRRSVPKGVNDIPVLTMKGKQWLGLPPLICMVCLYL
jgi:hypothetical protein